MISQRLDEWVVCCEIRREGARCYDNEREEALVSCQTDVR